MRRFCLALAACSLGLVYWAPSAGWARGWPTPAAGSSASGDPEVVFTFDDGPHEKHTAAILDELGKRHIQAIFFWVGRRISSGSRMDDRIALVRRAVREGHLIANHTITHPDLCLIDTAAAELEIDENIRLYEHASGLPMLLFRAPYGAYCKRLKRMLGDRSLRHLHWDIDPQEWDHHDPKRAARYVTAKLARLDGRAVVLMHDTHAVTRRALPIILDWIEEENERRSASGKGRPIRIIDASELVIESMDIPAIVWARDAAKAPALRISAALSRLIP